MQQTHAIANVYAVIYHCAILPAMTGARIIFAAMATSARGFCFSVLS